MKIESSAAFHLLHATPHAVLATHSTPMPGYPYATAVPLVLDEGHRPLLLVSALAEHTRNLLADGRASLAVSEAGNPNILEAARLTLVGSFEACTPSAATIARYQRYLPAAEQYLQLDFMFFRMHIERARHIAGLGRMGWLGADDWAAALRLAAADETSLLTSAEGHLAPDVQILGIDPYGIDYLAAGQRRRWLAEAPMSAGQYATSLPAIAGALA